ncbi:MAG: hypothetical protein ILA15_11695 [Clostridiales bacterium]|nr:hypothetical protein [Clostridiales bacterium]
MLDHEFWLNGDEPGGHSNRYNSVMMIFQEFSEDTKEKFEDFIGDNFGDAAMYGEITEEPAFTGVSFDIHKGSYQDAVTISKAFPDAIVAVDCGWDDYYFDVIKDGADYSDYYASWDHDEEPEPYVDGGSEHYDCDVNIDIKLPWTEHKVRTYTGGGCLDKDEYEYFKVLVDNHRREPGITR